MASDYGELLLCEGGFLLDFLEELGGRVGLWLEGGTVRFFGGTGWHTCCSFSFGIDMFGGLLACLVVGVGVGGFGGVWNRQARVLGY